MLYPKLINKPILCPTCQGERVVKVGNVRELHNHDFEPCRDCDAQGTVREISSIEYQKIQKF